MVQHAFARRDASRTVGGVRSFDNPVLEIAGALLGLAVAGLAILIGVVVLVCAIVLAAARLPARFARALGPDRDGDHRTPVKARV